MDTSKAAKREIVGSDHLSMLVSSYNGHFADYSIGWKNVSQVIPSVVWKKVFNDFVEIFPNCTIKESTLKERVRETLMELDTGNSNLKQSNTVALQSKDILKKI
jgi:hypothetical protein